MNYKNINDYETIYMIRENNDDYRKIMWDKYYPLIINMANKFKKYYKYVNVDMNDLIEEGNISLNKAIDSYNDKYNVKFITYFLNILKRKYISYFRKLITDNNHYNYTSMDEVNYNVKYSNDDTLDSLNNMIYKDIYFEIKDNLSFTNSCILELMHNGFNAMEIGTLLDLPINNVHSREYRIRKKAKEIAC